MAKRIETHILDDLTNEPDAEEVLFGFDGVHYRIDLTARNREKMEKALAPFLEKATRTGGKRTQAQGRGDLKEVRKWAQENGYEVAPRGVVPKEVLEAYDASQKKT